jgi:anti-anti-sigma factor
MAAPSLKSTPEGLPCYLRIESIQHGATSTIRLHGEWDLAQCDAARDAIDQALRRRSGCLVIDLSRLSFIDSSGIHVLVQTHRRCAEEETRLVLLPGPPAVQRVFEICDLIQILPFAPGPGSGSADTAPASRNERGVFSLRARRRRRPLAQGPDGAGRRIVRS